jgi:AraC family carnitine catabolism transcriptional activator
LEKARQLLRQTDMSVLEVSIACGFESPSYFTRSYRAKYERCPREDRRGAFVECAGTPNTPSTKAPVI